MKLENSLEIPFRPIPSLRRMVAFTYLALVLAMWLPFGPSSGMPYETGFAFNSETSSAIEGSMLKGFFYSDPLRIHTSTFYHLSYLLGELVGAGGSFVPYQVVLVMLWWTRGFLLFLILEVFLPRYSALNFLMGTLALVHSSDGAVQWVGQLNQYGYMFWMLAAFYVFLRSYLEPSPQRTAVWVCGAAFLQHMSLWSYESQIVIMLTLPLSLLLLKKRPLRRMLTLGGCWLLVPMVYVGMTIVRYLRAGGQTYQFSVMRSEWAISSVLGDWYFNIISSLKFWAWASLGPRQVRSIDLVPSLASVAISAGGTWLVCRAVDSNRESHEKVWITCLVAAAVGFVLLIISFPVYLLLDSARSLWRTQLLSSLGSAVFLGALIGLAHTRFPARWRQVVFLSLGGLVVFWGSLSAVQKGAFHYSMWERHRQAIAQVIRVAPSVKSGTLIMLANVPRQEDPFGDNMWFDVALRLAYPFRSVSGFYLYSDGTSPPGSSFRLKGERWTWNKTGFPPMFEETEATALVAIQFSPDGEGRLVSASDLPELVLSRERAAALYGPELQIEKGQPSVRALRRYRPFSELEAPHDRIRHAPVVVGVKPESGSGFREKFSFGFSDRNGYTELAAVQVLINSDLAPANGCYVHFDRKVAAVWLTNDKGDAGAGPLALSKPGKLENSQCVIDGEASSVSASGQTLTLDLAITFKPIFSGVKNLYATASDREGLAAGWIQRGSWKVGPPGAN